VQLVIFRLRRDSPPGEGGLSARDGARRPYPVVKHPA
jgi:hypothetical protein